MRWIFDTATQNSLNVANSFPTLAERQSQLYDTLALRFTASTVLELATDSQIILNVAMGTSLRRSGLRVFFPLKAYNFLHYAGGPTDGLVATLKNGSAFAQADSLGFPGTNSTMTMTGSLIFEIGYVAIGPLTFTLPNS